MSAATYLITLTFFLGIPGVAEATAGGFPAISAAPGQFLLKDLVLLAASLSVLLASVQGPWQRSEAMSEQIARTLGPTLQEIILMKAIVVMDQAAGTAGMKLVERPEPQAAINDVIVQIHASGFVPTELAWPSTWTDRRDRDRTPSIPGHELAGVVTALGYGTTGLSVGQRVFGLADWYRDGTLAEYVAIEARNLAPLPGDVDFTVGASLPISGLTALQGLFEHGRLRAGQSVIAHGAAGAVGSMVTQLAREAGAHVIGTGRAADRQKALEFGAQEFVDLDNDVLEDVGGVDLVFDLIGGDIGKRSARLIRAGGTLVSIVGPSEARPVDGLAIDFVVESDRAQLSEIVQRVRDGRLRTNIGTVSTLDKAVAAFNPTERRPGKTVIRVRP
jgi:NADPH:quinone reductase-like Zn-dependent oxidoreductase